MANSKLLWWPNVDEQPILVPAQEPELHIAGEGQINHGIIHRVEAIITLINNIRTWSVVVRTCIDLMGPAVGAVAGDHRSVLGQ